MAWRESIFIVPQGAATKAAAPCGEQSLKKPLHFEREYVEVGEQHNERSQDQKRAKRNLTLKRDTRAVHEPHPQPRKPDEQKPYHRPNPKGQHHSGAPQSKPQEPPNPQRKLGITQPYPSPI